MAYPKNIVECIQKLFPDAKVDIDFACEHPASGLRISEWNLPDPEPTEAELNAVAPVIEAEWDAQAYARSRQPEYPSIDDVTVALAEKMEGSSTMWDTITAQRLAVKAKYPKPS